MIIESRARLPKFLIQLWLNLNVPAGRILAKIMAEIKADGPVETNRMEEFLEDDTERNVFQHNLFQEVSLSMKIPSSSMPMNVCLLFLSASSNNRRKKSFRTLGKPTQEKDSTKSLHASYCNYEKP